MKIYKLWMFSLLLIVTYFLSGEAQEKEIPLTTEEEQLEQAERMIAEYYDKAGKRLTAILANEKLPIRQRVLAAKRLGIMKYPPAIPTLIRHNLLLDPDVQAISEDWSIAFPCVLALREYGDAAAPQVVEAYSRAEENSSDRIRLSMAIEGRSMRRTALIYAKGLAADIKEKDRSKRLDELIKGLSQ